MSDFWEGIKDNKGAISYFACLVMIAFVCILIAFHSKEPDKSDYNSGYEAAILGAPPEVCPYTGYPFTQERTRWMKGWLEGFQVKKKS